jgi:hypothetical protein
VKLVLALLLLAACDRLYSDFTLPSAWFGSAFTSVFQVVQ